MTRYVVQHDTLCGWVNNESEINNFDKTKTITYETKELAQASIDEFLAEVAADIASGDRDALDGYDADEFRVGEL